MTIARDDVMCADSREVFRSKTISAGLMGIHPRIAAGLAPLLNLQMRAIKTTGFRTATRKVGKALGRDGGAP